MSDVPNPATANTGPATFAQQSVSSSDQGYGAEIYQLVLKDIIERSEFGARKYGHALRATAKVNFLLNSYQETLDLLIYLRGELYLRGVSPTDTGNPVAHSTATLQFDEGPYKTPTVPPVAIKVHE